MGSTNSGATSTLRVALATCPELPQLDADTQWLVTALRKKSVHVSPAVWDDPNVDWAGFDLVVVLSCGDYANRRDEFLAWAERVPHLTSPGAVKDAIRTCTTYSGCRALYPRSPVVCAR